MDRSHRCSTIPLALVGLAWLAMMGCEREPRATDPAPPAITTVAVAAAAPSAAPQPEKSPCPSDMVLADGLYCAEVEQKCLAPAPSEADPEQCRRYADPARCLSEQREALRFCVDRYEWPNRLGHKPLVLVSWTEAQAHCASVGKRLCDEREWLFACEGEAMLPYTYGYERNPTACVIDRLSLERPTRLSRYDECLENEQCRQAFAKVDQRELAGSFRHCVSPAGAHDMNGNVSEWVNLPEATPQRSGIKGGSWGAVRDRCRPTERSHEEEAWGYEIGFRCCRNAAP